MERDMREEILSYSADGLNMRSRLFFEPASKKRPGVLVFPEAFGLDDHAIERAKKLASLGYAAMACDLHGDARVIPELPDAMAELQPLLNDPLRTRARAIGALHALKERSEVDGSRVAAMGFCFPYPIELARSGADIKAAVGFHTGLASAAPVKTVGAVKAHVLVCIGADDPFIVSSQRQAFEEEMRCVEANWQMNIYGKTVHSFTNPQAAKRNMPDAIRYNAEAADHAWAAALELFDTVL